MSWEEIPGRAAFRWIYDEWLASKPRVNARVVEVGVGLGKSIAYLASRCLAEGRDDITIYAVDSWAGHARNGEQDESGPPSKHGDWQLFLHAMQTHAPNELERVHILRATSIQASRMFHVGSVDLVILDADHSYRAVKDDITVWRPAIDLDTGWIGGDDYHPEEFPGLMRAVDEMYGTNVQVGFQDNWPTWLVRKGTRETK